MVTRLPLLKSWDEHWLRLQRWAGARTHTFAKDANVWGTRPRTHPPNSHILKYFTSNSKPLRDLAGTIPKSLTLKDRGQGGLQPVSQHRKILSRGLNRHFRPNLLNLPKIYFPRTCPFTCLDLR